MRSVMAMVAAGMLALPGVVSAQRGGNRPLTPKQQPLQKQVRQAFAGVLRRQLNLNDEQLRKLQDIDAKFQRQRSDLMRDERAARQDLRTALSDSTTTPDQAKVDGYLTRLVQAQRKRAEVLEAEQKELSGFLNPVQRAKFLALREQLQKRIAQIRQGDGRGGATPPPPPR